MSYIERHHVVVVTDSNGNGVGYTPVLMGRVVNVIYIKHHLMPFEDGMDVRVVNMVTGISVWNEDNVNASDVVSPVQKSKMNIGHGVSQADAPVCVAFERIIIRVKEGGAYRRGSFTLLIA